MDEGLRTLSAASACSLCVHMQQRMQPNDQTSTVSSYRSCRSISGAVKAGVPACVIVASRSSRLTPKSASLALYLEGATGREKRWRLAGRC